MYGLLADLTALVHLGYVGFVVLGQGAILLGWWRGWAWTRNRVFRGLHLAAIGIVILQAWLGVWCPLTLLENYLRERAGEAGHVQGFVADWVHAALFWDAPLWVFTLLYTAFGALVLLSYWRYPPRGRSRPTE
jgi:hypothetical protein